MGGAVGVVVARRLGVPVSASWALATAALAAVGHLDDQHDLPASTRLGAQLATGALLGAWEGGTAGGALGAVGVPAVVNAVNFMDGINGITGCTAVAWGLSAAGLGGVEATQGCLTAGMAAGFLPFNMPRARMFLGDVGSYLFGASMAVTALQAFLRAEDGERVRRLLPAAAPLTLYLADTGTTLVRRARRGEPLFEAHREHAYQRLVSDAGLAHWKVSTAVGLATGAAGLAARDPRVATVALPLLAGSYLASPSVLAGNGLPVNAA
ncbi:UDP-N-acetylmuramyl pentapeptide phosphotransferase/UDP-N-acetylglucosamine-1-phosphate transferase [Kytococcus sedentarius DSM 20547]|uniref:UDP-N-acetylmuramyl pentapeptide phosphotransferase/UDP-N-acetylglucosamine-1-phosphate transferase n=1 Tax=Kytococcus sedentarius (strain ATCC 14392 / DSM 20547 / JCM 11482 / CCUG 33030 / NBRC 15357 / NCTC 11040 / CCM 314 / 541) TaxID=478801 RepID=C7NJS9_KYTSD|nr:UDP-N-acetylmuramyl pentapeptide phosphotransferase/UDP-N-acetylglucosamine-1-phosphate transferase [Kytococcus sedentarius DSM 20547]